MDFLLEALLALAKAIITQVIALLFSKSKKAKKKTTRKRSSKSRGGLS